jgi:hypothetical protein
VAEEIPDIYTDQMQVTTGVFGVNITFALTEPHPVSGGTPRSAEPQVRVRMSLQHAKVIAMLLRRQLKNYEAQTGTDIQIPQNVYASLGIPEEDWR